MISSFLARQLCRKRGKSELTIARGHPSLSGGFDSYVCSID